MLSCEVDDEMELLFRQICDDTLFPHTTPLSTVLITQKSNAKDEGVALSRFGDWGVRHGCGEEWWDEDSCYVGRIFKLRRL